MSEDREFLTSGRDAGVDRRAFLRAAGRTAVGVSALALTGCYSVGLPSQPPLPDETFDYDLAYAALPDGDFTWPAINYKATDRQYWRQIVDYDSKPTGARPGSIVVDPYNRFLYWILSPKKALRYGVGVGKAGFAWAGDAEIRVKRVHPLWRPPQEMIARKPSLRQYWEEGMEPGLKNPLGARAMDLWQGNTDTLFRIHGTPEPSSIGTNASSGCIRMWHQDVIDLFERVPLRTKVTVLGAETKA
ncbi:L,D-transpeptidase [Roseibium aestuarii]|uniref:L,D-transpeptidase n=1 Tax=Roseibium aestuarii TaxID=2600299 RepID=A0ABW4JUB2_9HYPH|nr:L,D-transpeptidase [Roseibium aestuarii]